MRVSDPLDLKTVGVAILCALGTTLTILLVSHLLGLGLSFAQAGVAGGLWPAIHFAKKYEREHKSRISMAERTNVVSKAQDGDKRSK